MTISTGLSRRRALFACASVPVVAMLGAGRATAKAEMKGAGQPLYSRFMLGGFEVTTLLAGTRAVPDPHTIFGLNANAEDFAAASAGAFIPTNVAQFFFTPTVVNTGSELVLFDTGLNAEDITAALGAAGYAPGDVDVVVITHMHGDHVGGLNSDAGNTFANARYATGAAEHNYWMGAAKETFDTKVRSISDQFTFLDDGGAVASGITAIAAHGHTPGHMGYMIESSGKSLVLIADTANHPVWSLERPDWEVKFDAEKAAAAATRRKMLDMIAADRLPFIGYHMPFPATGFVEAKGEGYRYIPSSYQLMLA